MFRSGTQERGLVWIFGSPRSGSTWLLNLLGADPSIAKMDEPGIGIHLGVSVEAVVGLESRDPRGFRALDMRSEAPDYFFSQQQRRAWEPQLRALLVARLAAARGKRRWLVIKEPHGSDAADVILGLLPRSRMIFLLRDGRDVVDSELAAVSQGGWALRRLGDREPVVDREAFIQRRATAWMRRTEIVQRAYESHEPALRKLIRYEEMLTDRDRCLSDLADWLGLDAGGLLKAADSLDFSRMPRTGSAEFARAASPGLWRETMDAGEQAVLLELLEPKLAELGYR